jgi:WW domain-containing oxidoreductase
MVLARLRTEVAAYKALFNMLFRVLFNKNLYSKTSLLQFFKGSGLMFYEALTNKGKTVDDIAEEALGKGNFTALSGKVAIVTGANSGLGLQNARVLQKYGCHVIWAVRNVKKAQQALDELVAKEGEMTGKATILQVDISDLTTVKPFVTEFFKLKLPLHILILNAGIMAPLQWEPSKQGYESMFATNNLGHFLMSELLLPKLEDTAKQSQDVRIVILSSAAGAMCNNIDLTRCPSSKEEYDEAGDYMVSKAIDAFHARALQQKYKGMNIYATAVHPGLIETGLGGDNVGITTLYYKSMTFAPLRKNIPQGSATTMYCAVSPDVIKHVNDGKFFYYNCGPQKCTGISAPGVADHLIEGTEKLQLEMVKPFM